VKGRVLIGVVFVVVALLSAATGYYFGLANGSSVMGALASQNTVYDALADVRRSMQAIEAGDASSMHRKIAIDLRIALFSLGTYGPSVSYIKCRDQEKKAMESARKYMASGADPSIFNGAPELARGLNFCAGR